MSAPPAAPAPTTAVFISYAAQDPQWPADQVEALAQRLSDQGAEVKLDLWAERERGRLGSDDEWRIWMRDSLGAARHVLCLGSETYARLCERGLDEPNRGRGVAFESAQLEQWMYERKQQNDGRIWLFNPPTAPVPRYLRGFCPVYRAPDQLDTLVSHLCRPSVASRHDALRRRMRALVEEECVDLYVTLTGTQEQDRLSRIRLPQSTQRRIQADELGLREHIIATEHADLLDVVTPATRALLLGEPGAGKTFALLKVMQNDLDAGATPLWVKLNHWLDGEMRFEDFVAHEVPDLGREWTRDLGAGHCRLLLDGLNELPAEHAEDQAEQIAQWLQAHPTCPVLLSCREDDLPPKAFSSLRERLKIRPLRAGQIRQFTHNYIVQNGVAQPADAEAVFWQLVGGDLVQQAWAQRPPGTPDSALDDLVDAAATQAPSWLTSAERHSLAAVRAEPTWPYPMATNPYLLAMLLWVWSDDEGGRQPRSVPRRRVDVFSRYTRERLSAELEKTHNPLDPEVVQQSLAEFAAFLQHVAERTERAREAGVLAVPRDQVDTQAFWPGLDVALGARLLRQEGPLLRFRHQLLHEFYVARYLHDQLSRGADALLGKVWKADQPLWKRAGWVQPFLLLADYQHTDVEALLRTLVDIQPEVAGAVWAQTRQLNPSLLTEALAEDVSKRLSAQMLPPQPSTEFPQREAAFGRGLGLMFLPDGRPLDRRPGVWGWYDPQRGKAQVDIDWVPIPTGPFVYQGRAARIERAFLISRHPVTHSQFQAFVDDPNGWREARWWGRAPLQERQAPRSPSLRWANHPCTEVSWWAALAFCRWLAALRGEVITLPSEHQWERAAAGTSGCQFPWQGGWNDLNANMQRTIGRTSFCGLFTAGASAEGVLDLAGNVYEWTGDFYGLNQTGRSARLTYWVWDCFHPGARRAVRGGSWVYRTDLCRAGYRSWRAPGFRDSSLGFRLVCCPIQGL